MMLKNSDLYKKHEDIISLKKETYDRITKQLINSIKSAANIGELICFFEIPNIMFGTGYPIINIQYCANYVMNKINNMNSNIRTYFIEPNIIFVDWRRKDDFDKYYDILINSDKDIVNNDVTTVTDDTTTTVTDESKNGKQKKPMVKKTVRRLTSTKPRRSTNR